MVLKAVLVTVFVAFFGLVKLFPPCVLSAAGEFRDACVHLNFVGTSYAEELIGIERIGGGAQACWALPI